MRASTPLHLTIFAALLAGCGPVASPSAKPAVDTARIIDAIKTDEVHWNADYAARDAAKIAAHYAADAVAMSPGMAPAAGTAAIEAANKRVLDSDPAYGLTFQSDKVEVAASGDLAVSHGNYKETATDPRTKAVVTAAGSFVTTYKPQADGAWKAVWDINAPGAPVSVAAAMAGASAVKPHQ